MEKRTLIIIFVILVLFGVGALGAYLTMRQGGEKELVKSLMLSDYPEVFRTDTVIIVGEEASEVEKEAAGLIAVNLEELTGKRPEIITTKDAQNYKSTYNLIVVGTQDTNPLLGEIYYLTDAKEVTDEYPGEGKGILEILRNSWNPDKALLLIAGSDEWGVKGASIRLTTKSATITEEENTRQLNAGTLITEEFISIKGEIRVIGNEPFSGLVLTTTEGKNYEITGPKKIELESLQNKTLELQGFFRKGWKTRIESEGTIEVVAFRLTRGE